MGSQVDCRSLGDGELARLVVAGTGDAPAAEAELCRRLGRRVRLYGLRHLRSEHAAADLAQKAMLVMLEKLRDGGVREPDRIGSFVLGVARMLVHEARRPGPEQSSPEDLEDSRTFEMPSVDPFTSARLAKCLGGLGERERAVIVMTYYGESSAREVGATMGLQEGHIRVMRHRAILQLRECMNVQGPTNAQELSS